MVFHALLNTNGWKSADYSLVISNISILSNGTLKSTLTMTFFLYIISLMVFLFIIAINLHAPYLLNTIILYNDFSVSLNLLKRFGRNRTF